MEIGDISELPGWLVYLVNVRWVVVLLSGSKFYPLASHLYVAGKKVLDIDALLTPTNIRCDWDGGFLAASPGSGRVVNANTPHSLCLCVGIIMIVWGATHYTDNPNDASLSAFYSVNRATLSKERTYYIL